jgi:hypothetical protein
MANFPVTLARQIFQELHETLLAPLKTLSICLTLAEHTFRRIGLRNYLIVVWSLPFMIATGNWVGSSTNVSERQLKTIHCNMIGYYFLGACNPHEFKSVRVNLLTDIKRNARSSSLFRSLNFEGGGKSCQLLS